MKDGWKRFRKHSWKVKLFLLVALPAATLWMIAINLAYLVQAAAEFWYGKGNAGDWPEAR